MAHGHRDCTPHGRALVLVLWWLGHILQRKRTFSVGVSRPIDAPPRYRRNPHALRPVHGCQNTRVKINTVGRTSKILLVRGGRRRIHSA